MKSRTKKMFKAVSLIIGVLTLAMLSLSFAGSTPQSVLKDEQRIAGKWLRLDGGYVLKLNEVKEDGTLRAAYFNPQPIRISRANWQKMGERIQVFVELRDISYPGPTYTLIYDPKEDHFAGYYYQAALDQTFDVVFVRRK